MSAIIIPNETLSTAVTEVLLEAGAQTNRARQWPTDIVHGVAIVQDAVGALQEAAIGRVYADIDHDDVHEAAVQAAATALRFLISFNLGAYTIERAAQHDPAAIAEAVQEALDSDNGVQ